MEGQADGVEGREGVKLATAAKGNEEEAEEEKESRWSHIKAWRQRGQRCSLSTPLLPPSLHPAQTQTFSFTHRKRASPKLQQADK